jgi:hypothetical protein
LSVFDRRVLPFLAIVTALQAVRATTVITLAFFLQDMLSLDTHDTARVAGIGFVVLAVSGLFSQLVIVQRIRPSAKIMMRSGAVLMTMAFAIFVAASSFAAFLAALVSLGLGIGLTRPGAAAASSLAVEPHEQGSVAGVIGGISVTGNIFGPMLGTAIYSYAKRGPHLMNLAITGAVLVLVFTNRRVRNARA